MEDDFFQADIRLFGATALVPRVHDDLTALLQRGREVGGANVVGTVYDFRNEQRYPHQPWPLGDSVHSFPLIDLLVCDREEALKISGGETINDAVRIFMDSGVGSVVVTHGANGIHLASRGGLFASQEVMQVPLCAAIDRDLASGGREKGDTTGCGDNFLGGMLTSLALQMLGGKTESLSLLDACAWGRASGGYACFYPGGTFMEPELGFKYRQVEPYYRAALSDWSTSRSASCMKSYSNIQFSVALTPEQVG